MENSNKKAFDMYEIALDETDCFTIQDAWTDYIRAIEVVYVFDRNMRYALCETQLSYRLIAVDVRVHFTDLHPMTDELKEDISGWYYYSNLNEDIWYKHCHTIDALLPLRGVYKGTFAADEETCYDEQLDDIVEQMAQ